MFSERLRCPAVLCCLVLLIVCGERQATCQQTNESFQALAAAASAAREAGRADEAIRDYQRAAALRPDWAEGWWYLGTMQYDQDRYADAIPALKKLAALSPDLGAAWGFLGLSEFETKDYGNALAHLEKAQSIGIADDVELARVSAYHLALLLNRSGEFERAATLLLPISGQSQPPPQIKSALGMALLRVPLLPDEVDPSQDALIQAAGEAESISQTSPANHLKALEMLVSEHPQTPYLHYAYGLALRSAGQTKDALIAQQQEAVISPQSVLPLIQIGRLQLDLGQTPEAIATARKAVSLAPDSSAAHDLLAKALKANGEGPQSALETRKAASLLPEKPDIDTRIASLYAATSPRPSTSGGPGETSSTDWQQAMADYSAGRYAEAIAALKAWVEHKPNDGTAWAVMGLAEFELKDYDNALIHLQRGQQLGVGASPQAIELAKYRLAILLIRKSQFEIATELLGPIAGKQPLANEIQFALGLSLLRVPSLPDQIDASKRPLVERSGEIAQLLLASKYDQAFPKLQKLIEQYPTTPFLHYANGTALDSLSQYDDAKVQMRAEIQISPQSALPWARLASIALRQHLPNEALTAAENAVRLAPDSADAHYVLGRACAELGDTSRAIHELEQASQLSPNSPEIHFALARAYAKANLPEKASQERATFARLNTLAEQQRAQRGDQSYQGAHDAANSSILGTETSAPAPPPQ
jgi:tetratricopeptide (TPR) repeat protein